MFDLFLTRHSNASSDGAAAVAESARRVSPETPIVALRSGSTRLSGIDEEFVVGDVLARHGRVVVGLSDEELAVLALPFLLEELAAESRRILMAVPGTFLVSFPTAFDAALHQAALALTVPSAVADANSHSPHLMAARKLTGVSDRVIAVQGSSAIPAIREWQTILWESMTDPLVQLPSEVQPAALQSLLGRPDVACVGGSTLMLWSDYAAAKAGRADREAGAIVSCDPLIATLRSAKAKPGHELDVEWQMLADNVHDSRPLEPILNVIEEAVHTYYTPPTDTWFDGFVRDVQRASDPFGHRWGPGGEDLVDWLYQHNSYGCTRLADLYWRSRPDVWWEVQPPAYDPEPLRQWVEAGNLKGFGAHLFDRAAQVPAHYELDESDPDWEQVDGGVRNAVLWRLNILAGMLPGYEKRQKRRRLGVDPAETRGVAAPRRISVAREPSLFGDAPRSLSLIGCMRAESGLGQAARASWHALNKIGHDFTVIDTSEMYPSRNAADPGVSTRQFGAVGDVNLIHSNADELITLGHGVFRHRLGGRFNAAMWFWETADLPERSRPAFDLVDELWVASEYLVDVFGQYAKVPIHNIGLAADLPERREVERSSFHLREDEFVFLFVYDALSSHGRKNPEMALQAFIKAFAPTFAGVRFVLKVSNLNKFPRSRKTIMGLADTYPAITVIDEYYPRNRVLDLMAAADVYVSLHAAEGFGLTLLEAMALGTPAICTGYSGNMDFTNEQNSWLVDFTMMATDEVTGPYPAGSIWARPDVDSAADRMREVVAEADSIGQRAEIAERDAREAASLDRYAQRLGEQLRRVM